MFCNDELDNLKIINKSQTFVTNQTTKLLYIPCWGAKTSTTNVCNCELRNLKIIDERYTLLTNKTT